MIIDQRYRVIGELGQGVSGSVHLVEDMEEHCELALKFLRIDSVMLTPEQLLDRFKQEFRILKELQHPHIARIGDFGYDKDSKQHYFTEEHVQGAPITEAVQDASLDEIEALIVQCLRALEFLHARQIYHYDLKPANLFVTHNKQIKLIDFGLANLPGRSISGTPTYMAPEICLQQPRDGRVDLYALGVIWYQSLSGGNPFKDKSVKLTMERQVHFKAPPISTQRSDLPEYLDDVIGRLLAKNPDHRYGRAAQVIRDLNWLGDKNYPIETKATSAGYLPEVGHLVGRDEEWARIQQTIDQASVEASPSPPIILVVGDTGLGKTRICEEARYYAQLDTHALEIRDFDHVLTAAGIGELRSQVIQRTWSDGSLLIGLYPQDADTIAAWLPKEQVQIVQLKPFNQAQVREYLHHVTGMTEIPNKLCEALTTRTEGNPRLLRELLVACFSQSKFSDAFGRWTPGAFADLQQESEQLPLPSALEQWFTARSKSLPQETLHALSVLSICQHPVSLYGLETIVGPIIKWGPELIKTSWVSRKNDGFTLQNPSVREWSLQQLSRCDRTGWHDKIVKAASAFPDEDMDYHRSYGHDPKQIIASAERYTEKLVQQESWESAVNVLDWVWASLPNSKAKTTLGISRIDALIELARDDEVSAAIKEIQASINELPDTAQVTCQQLLDDTVIEWLLRQHKYEDAHQRIDAALNNEHLRPPAQLIRLKNYLGRIALEQGDTKSAHELLHSTWQEASKLDKSVRYPTANNDLGLVLLAQGQFDAAASHFGEELKAIRHWHDPFLEARCRYNLAEAHRGLGDTNKANNELQLAYELAQPVGRHELTLRILNAMGNLANESAQTQAAIDYYERGLRLAQRLGDRSSCAALATNLGILFHNTHENDDALSYLTHAEHLLSDIERTPSESSCLARCLLERALVERDNDHIESAEIYLTEAHKIAAEEGGESLLPFIEEAQEEIKMPPMTSPDSTQPQQAGTQAWQDLLHINQQLAHVTDIPALLQQILSHAVTMAHAEYGMILLLDNADELQVEASLNVEADAALKQISQSMAQRCIQSGAPLITDDAQMEDSFSSNESVMMAQLRAVAVIPIHAAAKVIGCVYLSNRYEIGAFRAVDMQLLAAFADQAGIAIDRARLLEASRQHAHQLEESLSERDQEISILEAQIQSKPSEAKFQLDKLISSNPKMGNLFKLIRKVGSTDLSVFIHGATGTGKEVMARQLHASHTKRSKGPFVALSCGAIPHELMESELFGYKAGAFTGATRDKVGLFEAANGGTLFLDEIAELPLELQAKLLRVLQEREVQRIGETTTRKIDCRILSASHQDIKARIGDKSFREDLYYRLCQIQLDIPSLQERREDIPGLIDIFIKRFCAEQGKKKTLQVDRTLLKKLMAYSWPGNVRELENLILAACALSDGKKLRIDDIPPHHPLAVDEQLQPTSGMAPNGSQSLPTGLGQTNTSRVTIDNINDYEPNKTWRDYEQLIIAKAFQHFEFDARKSASGLGISVAKMYKIVKELNLKDPAHPLYQEPFQYDEEIKLKDYMLMIFKAARTAAGGKPYGAIRNLEVSPGFFYKTLPANT